MCVSVDAAHISVDVARISVDTAYVSVDSARVFQLTSSYICSYLNVYLPLLQQRILLAAQWESKIETGCRYLFSKAIQLAM